MAKMPDLNSLITALLNAVSGRAREVVEKRYGLHGGAYLTLAALGEVFNVTRERIRQIENLALQEIRSVASKNPDFKAAINALVSHLKNYGGARREDLLIDDVMLVAGKEPKSNPAGLLHFVFDVSEAAAHQREDKDFYAYWYLDNQSRDKVKSFVHALASLLRGKKEEVVTHKKFDELFGKIIKSHNVSDKAAFNCANISRKFTANAFGDFGLAEWPEVNPKTARDWAYLILKKENRPLHFTALAEAINKVRKNGIAHPQTVHNELIKDDRFVLVGRGTYGLREFGIMPGTARDVIATLIQKHGPMRSKEVVNLVLKERDFKENTILLNLQNKKHFKRIEDGKYTALA